MNLPVLPLRPVTGEGHTLTLASHGGRHSSSACLRNRFMVYLRPFGATILICQDRTVRAAIRARWLSSASLLMVVAVILLSCCRPRSSVYSAPVSSCDEPEP